MQLHFLAPIALIISLVACQASTPHKTVPAPKPKQASAPTGQDAAHRSTPTIDATLVGPQKVTLEFAPGSSLYPHVLAEQGVQGEVKLNAQIKPDGFAQLATLLQNSGNPQLDQNALAFAQKSKFRLEKRRSATELETVEVEFRFHTHTLLTYGQKTCRQFIQEVNYFKNTFPNKPADEVIGYHAMSGMAFIYAMQKTANAKYKGSSFAQDVEFCQHNPDFRLMVRLLENNGLKATPKQ